MPCWTAETDLVSVMWANNETGALQPVEELRAIAHEGGALFHTDAVQALGTQAIRLDRLPADLMTVSSHKVYGPKGVGVLFVRQGVPVQPLQFGGQQYRQMSYGYGRPGVGSGNFCCDLLIADTCCECMGGDLCACF